LVVAASAFVTVLLTAGIGAAAPLAVTAVSAVLLRARPLKAPEPELELHVLRDPPLWPATETMRSLGKLFGGEPDSWAAAPPAEVDGVIVGRRRALDIDALVDDAVRSACAQAPGAGVLPTALALSHQSAEPTAGDHEAFHVQVAEYVEEFRAWLGEIDAFLTDRARILAAEIVQTNPSSIDALEARVTARLSTAFEPVTDLPEPPDAPARPKFPRRRSPLSLARSGFDTSLPTFDRPIFASALDPVSAVSMWEPDYRRVGDVLEVDYRRQTIRHGEREASGDPFMLRCPEEGSHEIIWEIHAANLEQCLHGRWTVITVAETDGDPIQTLADLGDVLAQMSPDDSEA
jgi:hypothetical protein